MYLVFDYGTTALKAALFGDDFAPAALASREWTYSYPAPGRIEIDPAQYERETVSAAREVLAKCPGAKVDAVSVTGQAETMIFLDKSGAPLGNAIVWLDTRAQDECEAFARAYGDDHLYEKTGNTGFDPVMPLLKMQWLRKHEPERYARIGKVLLLKEYIVYRLTGRMLAEGSAESCSGYYDITRGAWDETLLSQAGIDPALLPPVADSTRIAGGLTLDVGLPMGVPVVNGVLDQCAAFLGAGGAKSGVVTETTGTVLAVAADLPAFDPKAERMLTFRHALPGRYFALPNCPTAGVLLKWFRDQFMPKGAGYDEINAEIAARGRKESGLILLPHFAGCLSPVNNASARGAILGLSLDTVRSDVALAIMEGVSYLLRDNLELLSRRGIRADKIISLGGGAKSKIWLGVKANVCKKPMVTLVEDESTALGCAFVAALAIGALKTPEDTLPYVRKKATLAPDKEGEAIYDIKYQAYREANARLGFYPAP